MFGSPQQQAYDRAITIFSPDGRLFQVEYAREAVKRGAAALGLRTTESIVLLVEKGVVDPLLEPTSIEKLHKVDDHIGIATAGHVADGRHLIDFARRQAQIERLRYDEAITVDALTKTITDYLQLYTQTAGVRPFGVALLIGGFTEGTPRLYEVDPGGAPREWSATAIGRDQASLIEEFEDRYDADLSNEEGIDLALSVLAAVREDGLAPSGVRLATITAPGAYDIIDTATVAERLEALDLLADDSSE